MFREINLREQKIMNTLGFAWSYNKSTDSLSIYCLDRETNLELGLSHELTEASLYKLLTEIVECIEDKTIEVAHRCTLESLKEYEQTKQSREYYLINGYEKLLKP